MFSLVKEVAFNANGSELQEESWRDAEPEAAGIASFAFHRLHQKFGDTVFPSLSLPSLVNWGYCGKKQICADT